MPNRLVKTTTAIFCTLFAGLGASCSGLQDEVTESGNKVPSRARWHNNQGVVYMDQHNYTRGRNEFEKAIALFPSYAVAHANLGISLYSLGKYDSAATSLQNSIASDGSLLQAHYTLGLIFNAQGKEHEKALNSLNTVAQADPDDPHVRYYLGQVRAKIGQNEKAINDFKEAIRLDPYNISAYYGLANAHRRLGNTDDWRSALETFNNLSQAGHQGVSSSYQGQGRYAEVLSDASGANTSADDRMGPFTFRPSKDVAVSPLFATLINSGADGAIGVLSGDPIAHYLNGQSSVTMNSMPERIHFALAVDLNNDDQQELVLSGPTTAIMQFDGTNWTPMAQLPPSQRAAAADIDHDGDLDLLLMDTEQHYLLANNGQAGFNDVTASSTMAEVSPIRRVVFSDFDDDRDVDFFALSDAAVHLYSNNRDGTFSDVAPALGLPQIAAQTLAAEDFDQDGYMDLVLATDTGTELWHNEAGVGFAQRQTISLTDVKQLLSADLDNDGDLDLWALKSDGAVLLSWYEGNFKEVERLLEGISAYPAVVADFDRDGRTDLWSAGKLVFNQTEGGRWVRIALQGLNSNRPGIGTKVEIKTENRLQKREVRGNGHVEEELLFGLAENDSLEFVRILWPGGVRQTELATGARQRLALKELDRKGTSCPILYAWDGEQYRFVTDILGGGIIGYFIAPGQYYYPDSDEYVPLDALAVRDGRYTLKLANQLEEIIYMDGLELIVVDHPADVTVYPNERLLSAPPYPDFALYPLSELRPPRDARDGEGEPILDKLTEVDDVWYDDFDLTDIHGYAEEYSITLDLGDLSNTENPVLLAYGWVDYAHSSSNWAASQRGLTLSPPRIEASDGRGGWRLLSADMGRPAGLPKHMLFDLKGAFGTKDYRIRITTNAAIYWDQFLVGSSRQIPLQIQRLLPTVADLSWRGYPAHTSINGTFAFRYHYDRLHTEAPWGTHAGSYTRLGPVTELVQATDDRFAIMFHGDELSFEFSADDLHPPAPGTKRSFMLYASGFGKDMDFHSAYSQTVEPLPFHGMSSYPYPTGERYPQSEAHLEYVEAYNTRHVRGYYR